jgi:hypothetical protein
MTERCDCASKAASLTVAEARRKAKRPLDNVKADLGNRLQFARPHEPVRIFHRHAAVRMQELAQRSTYRSMTYLAGPMPGPPR